MWPDRRKTLLAVTGTTARRSGNKGGFTQELTAEQAPGESRLTRCLKSVPVQGLARGLQGGPRPCLILCLQTSALFPGLKNSSQSQSQVTGEARMFGPEPLLVKSQLQHSLHSFT